ncbi:MAG: bis(5'-nucleosyl)-tetraphosphatase (symmetrical) YqeK [Clostridia bacterium]|nr:bis(5'-nucleosyl)-tetraphosphatase (symmetrical) YqeK [Clostridia bacterium]
MVSREEMRKKLEGVLTAKRFVHSLNVMKTSMELAQKYGEDKEKAAIAGLLHDCAREIRGEELFNQCKKYHIHIDDIDRIQPELLHGQLGVEIAREHYGVEDPAILKAIRYHTTGGRDMSLLDKIVFIADSIEPNRTFPGVEELRKTAFNQMDHAVMMALDRTIKYVISKGALIHPDTIEARNYLILDKKNSIAK